MNRIFAKPHTPSLLHKEGSTAFFQALFPSGDKGCNRSSCHRYRSATSLYQHRDHENVYKICNFPLKSYFLAFINENFLTFFLILQYELTNGAEMENNKKINKI